MAFFDRFKSSTEATPPEKAAESPATEQTAEPATEDQSKRGFFARLKQGLSKTTQRLKTDIRDLFKSEGQLVDDEFLEKLRRGLVHTDIGPQAANQIVEEIAKQFRARVIQMGD